MHDVVGVDDGNAESGEHFAQNGLSRLYDTGYTDFQQSSLAYFTEKLTATRNVQTAGFPSARSAATSRIKRGKVPGLDCPDAILPRVRCLPSASQWSTALHRQGRGESRRLPPPPRDGHLQPGGTPSSETFLCVF